MEKLHSDLSDPELMAKLDQNDVDAWSELIHRYNKIAYSIAYQILRNQHDAEDAMQNTFVRLKIYASKFDKSQPLQPWLSRIAGAEAIRIYQKKKLKNKRESIRMDAIKIQPQSPKSDASARLEKSEANHLLHTAMNQLPDASRIALTLYYGSGLSQTEIAQQLGVSQVRVSERIKSGIEKLKIFLKKSGLTSIAFSSITFHQYCLALSPSPQFTERLASKLPNDTLIKSILNADVKPKRMASKSFFNATTIKWGIFFSLFCLASFLWINFKPKENIPATATTTTALPVATTTPIAEEKPNVLEWHKATLEDVTIFHYKPGMIQEKIEDPNKLVEGNILFTGNNGNWSFKVDDKQNTIFSRKTNDKKTRDGIHSKTFTEPHCFAGSIQFSVNDSLIELTMGSSDALKGMKIAKLASNDVVNPHQAYGQHRIIGSILAQKDVTLNFKLFVWKSETRWLSAILVNNALGKGSSFIPIHPATSPKNDYYLLFNTETKIDFINLRYAKLGKNWQPNDSEELQPFKDSWPSIENVEEPPKTFSLKIFSNGK